MICAFEIGVDLIRGERLMLKLVSRFVLEVLPYVLTALIAAIVVPGFISSHSMEVSRVAH
jgi:branched-subunit amino acid transport protein